MFSKEAKEKQELWRNVYTNDGRITYQYTAHQTDLSEGKAYEPIDFGFPCNAGRFYERS